MKNIFNQSDMLEVIKRIETLTPNSQAVWGTMSVGQMLAHCNVTYEMVYENIHPKPNIIVKFFLKSFVKKTVVGDAAYKHNSSTAPQFVIKETKNFDVEKQRLTDYILKTQKLGENHFDGKNPFHLAIYLRQNGIICFTNILITI